MPEGTTTAAGGNPAIPNSAVLSDARAIHKRWIAACDRHTQLLRTHPDVTHPAVKRSGQRCAALYSQLSVAAIEALEATPPATDAAASGAGEVEHLKDVIYHYQCQAGLAAEDAAADAEGIAEAFAAAAPKVATECPSSPDGRHQVDTSMEEGPNNCFHCSAKMGTRRAIARCNDGTRSDRSPRHTTTIVSIRSR